MAGIKDVARKAGVSISTVSRVMNNTKNVSPELIQKVQNAIQELDYSANLVAHSMRSKKSMLIAVIVPSFSRTFFTGVLYGINQIADEAGYTVLLSETHDSLENEMRLVNEFRDRCVDGIILASSAYESFQQTKDYINALSKLEKRGERIPVVTLEYAFENANISAVVIDNEKSAYNAVSYLIKDLGRKEIVHISLPSKHLLGQYRKDGYKKALREAGLPLCDDMIVEGDYTTYSGYTITNELIQSGKSFDAMFCANDQMAVGAILACNEKGIRVPEDIAIIGNDDIFAASLVRPSLTSVHVPQHEIGTSAMKILVHLMNNPECDSQRIYLDTGIVKRGSTELNYQDDLTQVIW